MAKISYHVSHEQFPPSKLLEWVQKAEQAGFQGALSSDHFHPWSNVQGHSGFAWSWLGAALARTQISFGIVNAPGQRYHPAIIAQASATLAEMFPGRFWMALGSGQALNEHITGEVWPEKSLRNQRLLECVEIIKALWEGQTVSHDGLVRVDEAKLYSLPAQKPLIVGAAITPETAGWVAQWADAMITVSHPIDELKEMVKAFRAGGGEGKPLILKYHVSCDTSKERALKGAFEQWKTNIFKSHLLSDLRMPEQFESAAEFMEDKTIEDHVKIFNQAEEYVDNIRKHIELGFDEIVIHNVNQNQDYFIDFFGSKILPDLLKK
jgi:coenzyme F420-dependent glucose-6-phosphate dehydrogenase